MIREAMPWQGKDLLAGLERLEAHLERVEPGILSLVPEEGRFERLRRQARVLLERFPEPSSRPALFGVPVAIKDVFHVDCLPTAAGSRLPPEELRGPQATCVDQLEAAGALILGKAACTEFAYLGAGPTRNPRRPTHTPGGSSSGSAAAVAARLCPLAMGTQTIGSICRPAAFCGVVGYKPSYDRISRDGLVPLAPSLDHSGPLALDVDWARLAAAVLCGDWKEDLPAGPPVLGVPEGAYLERTEDEFLASFRRIVERLEAAGILVRPLSALDDVDELEVRHRRIVAYEAARVHEPFFDRFSGLYHPKTVELVERGRQLGDAEYEEDLRDCLALRHRLEEQRVAAGVDLWLTPSAPGPAPEGLDFTGDPILNLPWSQAGLPSLSLPSDEDVRGLPLGVQLVGGWYADEAVLAWGLMLEEILAA